MKKVITLIGMIIIASLMTIGCSKVPVGHVGVKVYLLGGEKGVDHEILPVGRYWIGINEDLYLFPTFTQNYVWTKEKDEGSPNDESFNFQDIQGLELNADIGITYKINPAKVGLIFQKYKRGVEEITDIYLRNMVRDALVKRSSTLYVEQIYGEGRAELIENVQIDVEKQCDTLGIEIEKIYWIGGIKVPDVVKAAIDNKIKATQIAQQRENELREAEAAAKKLIAEAEGKAKSTLLIAEADSKSNKLLSESITPNLIEYLKVKRWNGVQPYFSGAPALINFNSENIKELNSNNKTK